MPKSSNKVIESEKLSLLNNKLLGQPVTCIEEGPTNQINQIKIDQSKFKPEATP